MLAELYCIILQCFPQYEMLLHDIAVYDIVLPGIAFHCMVLDGMAWHCKVFQGIANLHMVTILWYWMVFFCIIWYCIGLDDILR